MQGANTINTLDFCHDTTAPGVSVYDVDFTPELASNLLGANFKHNRALHERSLEDWRGALANANFLDNSPIRIAVSKSKAQPFTITDGQHRLTAIVESGMHATLSVVFIEVDAALDYADADSIQSKKLVGFVASLMGPDDISRLPTKIKASYATACKFIAGDYRNHTLSTLETVPLMSAWACEMMQLVSWMVEVEVKFKASSLFYLGSVLSVCLVATRRNPAKAKEFWTKLLTGDMLAANDPRKRLRDFILQNGGNPHASRSVIAPTTAKCWNAFLVDEVIENLNPVYDMPEIN